MKKLTNQQKILKALKSGPKKQADLARETKVKNTYQIVSDLLKKGLVIKDSGGFICIDNPPATLETIKNAVEKLGSAEPKPESEIITTLRGEVENIQDGIRSLMITRTYLLRRIEEEKRNA